MIDVSAPAGRPLNRVEMRAFLADAWAHHAGMGICAFAERYSETIKATEQTETLFIEDMLTQRLTLDIRPLAPEHDGKLNILRVDAPTLEGALADFSKSRRMNENKTLIWSFPERGFFGELTEMSDRLAEKPTIALVRDFRMAVQNLETLIEQQGDFKYKQKSRLIAVPLVTKGQVSPSEYSWQSSLIPHSDPSTAFVFNLRGPRTLLFDRYDLTGSKDFRYCFPRHNGPLPAYEAPARALVALAPYQPHAGQRTPEKQRYGRAIARSFMEDAPRGTDDGFEIFKRDLTAEVEHELDMGL
jgi:hypothetical protein